MGRRLGRKGLGVTDPERKRRQPLSNKSTINVLINKNNVLGNISYKYNVYYSTNLIYRVIFSYFSLNEGTRRGVKSGRGNCVGSKRDFRP